jgi:hypothetical protein
MSAIGSLIFEPIAVVCWICLLAVRKLYWCATAVEQKTEVNAGSECLSLSRCCFENDHNNNNTLLIPLTSKAKVVGRTESEEK